MVIENWKSGLICIYLAFTVNACKRDDKSVGAAHKPTQEHQSEELTGLTYAVTQDGKRLLEIPEPDSIRIKYKEALDASRVYYLGHLSEPKSYLMYGIHSLDLGMVENAIQVLDKGIGLFPNTADLYLYRGIAAVQGRQFTSAINDFWKAGKAVEGQKNVKGMRDKNEIEKKIDATLQYEIYNWMGLAFQSQGDFSNAEKMYEVCGDFSTNSDLYCMSYYWQYQAYKRAGRDADADQILKSIEPKMFISEGTKPFLDAMLYYKGILKENELINLEKLPQSSVEARDWMIKAYAIAIKSVLEKKEAKSKQILEKIVALPYWNQMAYIAAEADLHKLKGFNYKEMKTTELSSGTKRK